MVRPLRSGAAAEVVSVALECERDLLSVYDALLARDALTDEVELALFDVQRALLRLRVLAAARALRAV